LVAFTVQFPDGVKSQVPLFVVSGFETQEDQIHDVILNLKAHGQTISPNFPEFDPSGHLSVQGLLGVDISLLLSGLQSVPCLSGIAFEVENGVIPYGDTSLYLPFEKIHAIKAVPTRLNPDRAAGPSQPGVAENQPVEGGEEGKPLFGMEPPEGVDPTNDPFAPWPSEWATPCYFEPLSELFPESHVQHCGLQLLHWSPTWGSNVTVMGRSLHQLTSNTKGATSPGPLGHSRRGFKPAQNH
jgi:hypothetical protein